MTVDRDIAKIYLAYLNRAPDPGGLQYWNQDIGNGSNLENAALAFVDAKDLAFPWVRYDMILDPREFIIHFYQNVFERNPSAGDINYWVDQAQKNQRHDRLMPFTIINGAQGKDKETVEAKLDVGLYATASFLIDSVNIDANPAAKALLKDCIADVSMQNPNPNISNGTIIAGRQKVDRFIASLK